MQRLGCAQRLGGAAYPQPAQQRACRSSRRRCLACAAAAGDDPRLTWARPEWIASSNDAKQQQQQQPARAATAESRGPAPLSQKQRHLVGRLTYGADGPSSSSSSSSSSRAEPHEQLFQALGIDFGQQRVGIAIRQHCHNVPLLTLHREQPAVTPSGAAPQPTEQQQQRTQAPQLLSQQRVAAAVLQLALEQGCDGFVVGLPEFPAPADAPPSTAAAAAGGQRRAGSSPPAAARAAAASAVAVLSRRQNIAIRGFAQRLADLAAPLELPVLLVNEQQSSQQARAVMAGAAAYDVTTLQQLEAAAQQQQQQPQGGNRQQPPPPGQRKGTGQPGRDAFAAALILSRYYNGLAPPERVAPGNDSSSSSSSSSTGGWSLDNAQKQAVRDLRAMRVPAREQRRRQRQRQQQQLKTAAAE